ncbi:hypothetical protein [Microbacterium sp.]|uniref:hypothetical protein n=1 Tax=Microbacterium sp. TaxID=51671 RepID=UPI0028112F90|nr:hypothetical protein [Microbacterium sp.]
MTHLRLIRRLITPPGWQAPTVLRHGGLRAEALTRHHLVDDVRGINASIRLIRRTRGGRWPTAPVTEESNYVDLVWHECEFRDKESFAYAVFAEERYIGNCYLYPVGRRTPATPELLEHDVDLSWWVTPDAYAGGLYAALHRALNEWATTDFPFTHPHFSNIEMPA